MQITLKEISKEEVDFFNISNIMEYCKDYLLSNYPSLTRIEKYKYGNLNEKDIIKGISKEFGREYQIENLKTNDLEL